MPVLWSGSVTKLPYVWKGIDNRISNNLVHPILSFPSSRPIIE
jgi:hypothetical protein